MRVQIAGVKQGTGDGAAAQRRHPAEDAGDVGPVGVLQVSPPQIAVVEGPCAVFPRADPPDVDTPCERVRDTQRQGSISRNRTPRSPCTCSTRGMRICVPFGAPVGCTATATRFRPGSTPMG